MRIYCVNGRVFAQFALAYDVNAFPDAYSYARAKRFKVSPSGLFYALRRLGVSDKKSLNHPKADAQKRLAFNTV